MYRRSSRKIAADMMGLDSLMDVLTCSVGVMLFVVIFAVLEARSVNVQMITPILHDPPNGSSRILVLCQKGKVRIFDVTQSIKRLFDGVGKLTFETVPEVVKKANKKHISDHYFKYSLDTLEWNESFGRKRRAIKLVVNEQPHTRGETADKVTTGSSEYEKILANYDNTTNWLAFGVDKESIEVFREARTIALSMGFTTGWSPETITLPYTEVIVGGDARRQAVGKPKSGLESTQ